MTNTRKAPTSDLTRELEKHKGKWVAVFQDRVVAVGDSPDQVLKEAEAGGITDPVVYRVPTRPDRLAFF